MQPRLKEALAAVFIVLCGGCFFRGIADVPVFEPLPSRTDFWPPRGMPCLVDALAFLLLTTVVVAWSWWLAAPGETWLESSILRGAALYGSVGTALWLVGSLWSLQVVPVLGAIFVVGALLAARRPPRSMAAHFMRAGAAWRSLPRLERLFIAYLAFMFLLTLILTLAPPTGIDYDAMMYHLAGPAQYLRVGRVVELPYDHHTYFPFLTEMLYLCGLWAHGPVPAKLFHWVMLPVGCGALAAIGQRHLSLRAGLAAAAFYTALPVVALEASTAYIDLTFTAFALLAFLGAANWLATRERRWLIWTAVFCGFCLGTKYLGALVFGWLFLWLVGCEVHSLEKRLRPILLSAVTCLLVGAGWYLRNFMWTRNPVFPFAYEIFDGKGWTLAMAQAYTADQKHFGFGTGFTDLLWLPWRLSMAPVNIGFVNGHIEGLPFWPISNAPIENGAAGLFEVPGSFLQTYAGPLLLALGAPAICMRRKPAVLGMALWMVAFLFAFWFVTGQYLRYLFPAFALLCLAAGWGFAQWRHRGSLLKTVSGTFVVAWLLFVPCVTSWNAQGALPAIFGHETSDEYLTRTFAAYDAMQWAAANTPSNARFAVYGEPRCFYLRRDYFWADPAHNRLVDYSLPGSSGVLGQLRALGAGYLLVNTRPGFNGGGFEAPAQIQEAMNNGSMTLLYEAHGYRIYSIFGGGSP